MDFDVVFQYRIPHLHPLTVHLPLVILMLGAGVAAAYAVRGTAVWRRAALCLYGLGAPATWIASRTGQALEHEVEGEPMVDLFVEMHEQAAAWTLWAAVLALLVFAAGTLWLRQQKGEGVGREPLGLRLGALVPALAAALLVAWTGHLGGLMVWGVPVR